MTSTGSGLAVPDWPLSYGQLMPPMVGGIRFEHGHRMIASFVGLLTMILMFWLGFGEKRAWLRRTGILAFGMVVIQGVLGGLTVMFLLPPPISILHASLAQTFFGLTVCMAYATSREWNQQPMIQIKELSNVKKMLWLALILIYGQLILGAAFRHTGNQGVVFSHVIGALLVAAQTAALLIFTLRNCPNEKKIINPVLLFGAGTFFQSIFGMGAFIYKVIIQETVQPSVARVWFVTIHQTLGAVLLATCFFMLIRVYRLSKLNWVSDLK